MAPFCTQTDILFIFYSFLPLLVPFLDYIPCIIVNDLTELSFSPTVGNFTPVRIIIIN